MSETPPNVPLTGPVGQAGRTSLAAILDALSRPDFVQAAAAAASVLARDLGCNCVAIGMVEGHATELVALSGSASTRTELALPRKITAAMNESVDQAATLRYPAAASDMPHITLMHGELASTGLGAAILSIPLPCEQEAIGAIVLMRSADNRWTDAELLATEQMASLIGPILKLKQRAHESLWKRARRIPGELIGKMQQPGAAGMKLLALATLAGMLLLGFIPVKDRVSAPARLEGMVERSVAAPVDSFIQEVLVRPGAQVATDEVLITLADQDLRFEQSRLEAELGRFRSEQADAFARQDRSRMVSAEARAEEIRSQLSLVQEQIERTRITAPFPGVVIRGDLAQQAGAPVKRGDVLMVLAPSADFRLVLKVADSDIARLKEAQQGLVTFSALPHESFPLEIRRITPVASVVEGSNSFEVEAALNTHHEALRPGFEGLAYIDMGRRPIAAIWGQQLLDWFAFRLWVLFG